MASAEETGSLAWTVATRELLIFPNFAPFARNATAEFHSLMPQQEEQAVRQVRFAIDGRGPIEGMMKYGTIGDGEIEFVAIPTRAGVLAVLRTVQVSPQGDDPFEAPIIRIITDASCDDEVADTMPGFVSFETV